MPEEKAPLTNGVHEQRGENATHAQSVTPARPYNQPGRVGFLPGNPGRTWAKDKRSKSAQDIIAAYGKEPLAVKMEQMHRLEAQIAAGDWKSDYERLETEKLLHQVTQDVMQYRHQKLKHVESHTQLEILQQLQQLDSLSDEQLKRLMDEAEELIKQLPPQR
jgi:hypothetical protein